MCIIVLLVHHLYFVYFSIHGMGKIGGSIFTKLQNREGNKGKGKKKEGKGRKEAERERRERKKRKKGKGKEKRKEKEMEGKGRKKSKGKTTKLHEINVNILRRDAQLGSSFILPPPPLRTVGLATRLKEVGSFTIKRMMIENGQWLGYHTTI